MSLLSRIASLLGVKAAPEAAYRDGPWVTSQGLLPHAYGQYINYWQLGFRPLSVGTSAMVEACVSAYAQTTAMCPFTHWRDLANGGREKVVTSALSRVMRQPNDYQTRADFLLNLARSLYLDGNAYALALRNNRFEIASLHLMHPKQSYAQVYEGEVFYSLAGNEVIESRLEALDMDGLSAVPARDVLHVKLHTPVTPLRGETPLAAAELSVAAANAAMLNSIQFYGNQSRPSGVLQTDLTLTSTQVAELRERWDTQSKGLGQGGTPILTSGLKFAPVSVSPKDTQFAESMKLSDAQIAEVFRVPLAIIGSEQQPMGSTEAAMNWWIAGGLGFCLNQIELAYDKTFGLTNGEYSELDTAVLLRSAFKDRIEGLVRGVQGGIYTVNEGRAAESLPEKDGGDEPRLQQQMVPLSLATEPPVAPAPPAPAPPAANDDNPQPDDSAAEKMTVTEYCRFFEEAS